MDLRPWDLWSLDGQPRPETPEIVATLEGVLQKAPEPPGREPLLHPCHRGLAAAREGLPSAARLATLVPGAGHLVHMPAHIYMRTGRYADRAEANRQAIAVDERYIAAVQPAGVYPMMYYPHNIHFLWAATCMEGRSGEAISAARDVSAKVPPGHGAADADGRVLHPRRCTSAWRASGAGTRSSPSRRRRTICYYNAAMWHYARGLA